MSPPLVSSLATLPDFLAYFATAVAFATLFVLVYVWITPQRELALIRANVPAAAISFGGAFIGFVIPLASAIAQSVGLVDGAVWSAVALVVQLLAFLVARLLLPDLPARIARDERAAAMLVAALSIGVGILDAACMTW
jgi:putative membrane protein